MNDIVSIFRLTFEDCTCIFLCCLLDIGFLFLLISDKSFECFIFRSLSISHRELLLEIVHNIWSTMLGDYLNPGTDNTKSKESTKSTDNMESTNSTERRTLPVIFTCQMVQLIKQLLAKIRSF